MALPDPSILSEVAQQLGDAVNTSLSGNPKVRIGPPSEAETGNAAKDQLINLFLYRFEPSGFHAEATTGDPLHMRIHCLVTAYGTQETTGNGNGTQTIIGAGEVDLRLLGGVAQHFHENPVRDIVFRRTNPVTTEAEEIRTTLQIVLKPLSSEEINQIWSTQGNASYRSSLAYELALAPVTPWTKRVPAPPVDAARIEMIPPDLVAPVPSPTGASGPELHRISDDEMALILQGKTTPPEQPPQLSFAATTPPHRKVVRVWPLGGGAYETEVSSIDLTYTPLPGLSSHQLLIYRRDGEFWQRVETRPITVPGGGTATIAFVLTKEPGDWLFFADAIDASGEIPKTYRSAAVALELQEVSQAPAGGGTP